MQGDDINYITISFTLFVQETDKKNKRKKLQKQSNSLSWQTTLITKCKQKQKKGQLDHNLKSMIKYLAKKNFVFKWYFEAQTNTENENVA